MRARVIGLGQAYAGDDAVGLAVLQALRERGDCADVALHTCEQPSALIPLLEEGTPVVLVDAVLAHPPGQVVELDSDELAAHATPMSSHGLDVAQAIALARALAGERPLAPLRVVAITIAPPERLGQALSPEVARAVPSAVARVLSLIGGDRA